MGSHPLLRIFITKARKMVDRVRGKVAFHARSVLVTATFCGLLESGQRATRPAW